MYIFLLRHGDALQQGYDYVNRPLSTHGEEQAGLAASFLEKMSISIDAIFNSFPLRAKQTANIVNHKLHIRNFNETEYLIPGTDHRQLFNELNKLSCNAVLLVGHEPYLSTLISLLISGLRKSQVILNKGSLAFIEGHIPIQLGSGLLRWLLSPECMK